MIKYLGSKRTLTPVLGLIAESSGANTATDLFTGTTRVAQEFKNRGVVTTAADIATYSEVFAQTYITADADGIDMVELQAIVDDLNTLTGVSGYVTEEFCEKARYFHPKNGARIDTIRDHVEEHYKDSDYYPILLTSLIEAADRVDSTVGLQMAYLKQWAARAHKDMELRVPELLSGTGHAVRGDAMELIESLPKTDLLYLDPPYNQHRYFTNYHVWETLVRWDKPQGYGIANKRLDAREDETKSVFNKKREMPLSFKHILDSARADLLVVSFNNEGWISAEEMVSWLEGTGRETVVQLDYDFKRHVGAQIGIHNLKGEKVGAVKATRNLEHIFLAGDVTQIKGITSALEAADQG